MCFQTAPLNTRDPNHSSIQTHLDRACVYSSRNTTQTVLYFDVPPPSLSQLPHLCCFTELHCSFHNSSEIWLLQCSLSLTYTE